MVLFFVVDTSGSMAGAKIGALNNVVEEILPMVGVISKNNNDAKIEIAVLQFQSGVKWSYPSPMPAEGFSWRALSAGGGTDFGAACKELATKLTRETSGMIEQSETGYYAPAFILLSDGYPTDSYQSHLQTLKNNKWFKNGIKVAIAIEVDNEKADKKVLAEFAGTNELVYTAHDIEALKTIIKFVTLTVSRIGSKSSDTDANKTKQVEVKEAVDNEVQKEIKAGTITSVASGNSVDGGDWE